MCRARVADQINMTAKERCRCVRTTFERNMNPIDAFMLGNLHHPNMHISENTGRSVGDLARTPPGIREQILNRCPACVAPYHHSEFVAGYTNDVGQILDRVEGRRSHVRCTEDVRGNM